MDQHRLSGEKQRREKSDTSGGADTPDEEDQDYGKRGQRQRQETPEEQEMSSGVEGPIDREPAEERRQREVVPGRVVFEKVLVGEQPAEPLQAACVCSNSSLSKARMKMIGMRPIRRAMVAASKNQQPASDAADPRERTSGRVALCAPSSSTCIWLPVSLTQVPAPSKAIADDLAAIAIAAPSIGNEQNAADFR